MDSARVIFSEEMLLNWVKPANADDERLGRAMRYPSILVTKSVVSRFTYIPRGVYIHIYQQSVNRLWRSAV